MAAVGTDPIVKEKLINASPETVFAFFTEPDKLMRWLCIEATTDPRPGGINHQTHVSDEGVEYLMRGEFVEVSPPSRVVFTWGYENSSVGVQPGTTTVEVNLTPADGGTLVRLEHRDIPEPAAQGHDQGWDTMLERLAEAARIA